MNSYLEKLLAERKIEPIQTLAGKSHMIVDLAQHTEKQQQFIVLSRIKEGNVIRGNFLLQNCELIGLDNLTALPEPVYDPHPVWVTVWEHYKSTPDHRMTYFAQGVGIVVDNLEQFVLYQPLYDQGRLRMEQQGVTCLARPLEMFFSEVEVEGYKGPRFRKIGG